MEAINKKVNITKVSNTYMDEFVNIIQLGIKMGYTKKDIEQHPILLLHFFYSWLEENKFN